MIPKHDLIFFLRDFDMKWPNQVLRTDNQANVVVAFTVILLSKHVHMAGIFKAKKISTLTSSSLSDDMINCVFFCADVNVSFETRTIFPSLQTSYFRMVQKVARRLRRKRPDVAKQRPASPDHTKTITSLTERREN